MGTNVLPGEPRSGPERSLTMGAPATRPRSAAAHNSKDSTPPPSPSPPLAPQISSSRLNRLFYFISLSSGEQRRPTPSVSFSLSPFLSASGAQSHGPHPPERTEQSQSASIMFLVKFFMKRLQFHSEYIL